MIVVVVYFNNNRSNSLSTINKNISITEKNTIKSSIDKVYDSVLVIESYKEDGTNSVGSGFIYKKDNKKGYILTNYHVVKSSDSIVVINNNNEEYAAKLLGFDEQMDLAVLCIDKKYVSQVATLSKSKIYIGDTVFTVGSPEGIKYQGTVTKGIISGLNREVNINVGSEEYIMSVIQTDAAINPGNSGGPLVNINGEVIGINSLKIVQNEIEGMGFAIPIEEVLIYTDRLEQGKIIERPYLGYELMDTDNGVMVKNIKINSIESDIKVNDILVSIDGMEIKNKTHFRYLLYKHSIGDEITVDYYHNGSIHSTKIKL